MNIDTNNNNNNTFINTMFTTIKWAFEISAIYLLWIVLHYCAAILYSDYCTPLTLKGFLMSPFLVPSPHCRALRWVINTGSDVIINMWIVFGTWIGAKLCGNLLQKNKDP